MGEDHKIAHMLKRKHDLESENHRLKADLAVARAEIERLRGELDVYLPRAVNSMAWQEGYDKTQADLAALRAQSEAQQKEIERLKAENRVLDTYRTNCHYPACPSVSEMIRLAQLQVATGHRIIEKRNAELAALRAQSEAAVRLAEAWDRVNKASVALEEHNEGCHECEVFDDRGNCAEGKRLDAECSDAHDEWQAITHDRAARARTP